jgi:predicted outer membrane repeat protein
MWLSAVWWRIVLVVLLVTATASATQVSKCYLHIHGRGTRLGVKNATLSCTGKQLSISVKQDWVQPLTSGSKGVTILPHNACATPLQENCSLVVCSGTHLVLRNALVTDVYAPDDTLVCIGGTSAVEVQGSNFSNNRVISIFEVRLSSFEVTDSYMCDNKASGSGGLVWAQASEVSIQDTVMCRNTAADHGGVLITIASNVQISNSTIFSNQAQGSGGAVLVAISNLTMVDSVMELNEALAGPQPSLADTTANDGGAVSALMSNVTLERTHFLQNSATGKGGALYLVESELSMRYSTVHGNTASDTGGAVVVNRGNALIQSSVFSQNSAALAGGAIEVTGNVVSSSAVLQLVASEFAGNTAHAGGAIAASEAAHVYIAGSNFSRNTAVNGSGGGLNLMNATAVVHACRFVANNARRDGGGADVWSSSSLLVSDSIWSLNEAGKDGGALCVTGGIVTCTRCSFNQNTAEEIGGGLTVQELASSHIVDCAFHGNVAVVGGGLAAYWAAAVDIDGTNFTQNWARRGSIPPDSNISLGGAISARSCDALTARQVNLFDNHANTGGAIFSSNNSYFSLDSSNMASNMAGGDGGALFVEGGYRLESLPSGQWDFDAGRQHLPALVTGCMIRNNVAIEGFGGGVRALEAQLMLRGNTALNNSAAFKQGGALHITRSDVEQHGNVLPPSQMWQEDEVFGFVSAQVLARGLVSHFPDVQCGDASACVVLPPSRVTACNTDDGRQVAYHYNAPGLDNPCSHKRWCLHVTLLYTVFAGSLVVAVVVVCWAQRQQATRRRHPHRRGSAYGTSCSCCSCLGASSWWPRVSATVRALLLAWDLVTDAVVLVKLRSLLGGFEVMTYNYRGKTVPIVAAGWQPVWLFVLFALAFFAPYCCSTLLLHADLSRMAAKRCHQQSGGSTCCQMPQSGVPWGLLPYAAYASCTGCTGPHCSCALVCCIGLIFPWLLLSLWLDIPILLLHAACGDRLVPWLNARNYFDLHSFLAAVVRAPYSAAVLTYVYSTEVSAALPVEVNDGLFWFGVGSSLLVIEYWAVRLAAAAAKHGIWQLFKHMFCELVSDDCWPTAPLPSLQPSGCTSNSSTVAAP